MPDTPAPRVELVRPTDGGQTKFLTCWEGEVGFGGQAGPGKSWVLVFDALGLQFEYTSLGIPAFKHPEYRAVIFRRKTTELAALIDEGKKLYKPLGADFVLQRLGDPGPSFSWVGGGRIFLCHMKDEGNKDDHQGQEYQYIGFDELTQFSLTQYLYLFSRARTTVPELFTRVRSTFNPVGSGLVWVKKRFIAGLKPEVTSWFRQDGEPEQNPRGTPTTADDPAAVSRRFIPGVLDENPYVDKAAYRRNVSMLGPRYVRALLKNDWDAFGGDFFSEFDQAMEVIEPFDIPPEWPLICAIDPGYSSPCSASLKTRDFNGAIYRIGTYYFAERSPGDHALGIREFWAKNPWTHGRKPSKFVAGLDAWAKRDRYAVIANELTFADAFKAQGMILQPAVTDRIHGWWAVRSLMPDRFFVFRGLNEEYLEELLYVQADEKEPEDISGKGNDPKVADHALDEDRYGTLALFTPKKKEEKKGWAVAFAQASQKKGGGWKPGMG